MFSHTFLFVPCLCAYIFGRIGQNTKRCNHSNKQTHIFHAQGFLTVWSRNVYMSEAVVVHTHTHTEFLLCVAHTTCSLSVHHCNLRSSQFLCATGKAWLICIQLTWSLVSLLRCKNMYFLRHFPTLNSKRHSLSKSSLLFQCKEKNDFDGCCNCGTKLKTRNDLKSSFPIDKNGNAINPFQNEGHRFKKIHIDRLPPLHSIHFCQSCTTHHHRH